MEDFIFFIFLLADCNCPLLIIIIKHDFWLAEDKVIQSTVLFSQPLL